MNPSLDGTTRPRLLDARNPDAIAYARRRLRGKHVRTAGLDPSELPALWRGISDQVYQGHPLLGRSDVNLSGDAYGNGIPPGVLGAATRPVNTRQPAFPDDGFAMGEGEGGLAAALRAHPELFGSLGGGGAASRVNGIGAFLASLIGGMQ